MTIFYKATNRAVRHLFWQKAEGRILCVKTPARLTDISEVGSGMTIFYKATNRAVRHLFWQKAEGRILCVKTPARLTDISEVGSGMTMVVNRRLAMDCDGWRDTSCARSSGSSRRPLTRALATEAETSVRSCRGPERRLNKARMERATPAVNGSELNHGCRIKVCVETRKHVGYKKSFGSDIDRTEID